MSKRFGILLLLGALLAWAPLWGGSLPNGMLGAPRPDASAFAAPLATTSDASYNWSGYVAHGGEFTAVSGTWIVPEVSPGEELAADAAWVGIGGSSTRDLIQAGTQAIVSEGRVYYQTWYELLPAVSIPLPLRIAPGDEVSVSIVEIAPDYWHISLTNNTTGRSHSLEVAYESSRSSAEWVQEMPSRVEGGFIPLSNFGEIYFLRGSTVKDGVAMTPEEAGARPLAMVNYVGEMLALPSVLAADGAFSVVRTNAPAYVTRPTPSPVIPTLLQPL